MTAKLNLQQRPRTFFRKRERKVAAMIKELGLVIPSTSNAYQKIEEGVDIPIESEEKDELVVEINEMGETHDIESSVAAMIKEIRRARPSTSNAGRKIEEGVDIPIESEKTDELVVEIKEMGKTPDIESSKQCRIYKVPNQVRKWNEDAYAPQVVSIGPFHRKKERLKAMEEHKERYLRSFLEWSQIKVEDLVGVIRDSEDSIRGSYEETIDLTTDGFVKMILLDAIFILELFIRVVYGVRDDPNVVEPRGTAIMVDLLLLENQLPFFAIRKLYDLASPVRSNYNGLLDLCFNYFCNFNLLKITPNCDVQVEHFTDLIRTFHVRPPGRQPERSLPLIKHLYSATQLQEAGVKFEVGESNFYSDIKFKNGVLKIPSFQIEARTEIVARNIMALEQTRYIEYAHYTDYFIFLDYLINTTEDVDLLCDKGILVNILGDNDGVKSMINNLHNCVISVGVGKDYFDLSNALNGFYEDPWHKFMATLKSDYFGTPWKTASTVAAIILLVLTFIQTVLSFIPVVRPK